MTVNNLSKIYHATRRDEEHIHAITTLDFAISPGEFIGVAGGSGKSTLAKLLMRGKTQHVLTNPQHPYTRELINAIPPTNKKAIWPPLDTDVYPPFN